MTVLVARRAHPCGCSFSMAASSLVLASWASGAVGQRARNARAVTVARERTRWSSRIGSVPQLSQTTVGVGREVLGPECRDDRLARHSGGWVARKISTSQGLGGEVMQAVSSGVAP